MRDRQRERATENEYQLFIYLRLALVVTGAKSVKLEDEWHRRDAT